MDNLPPQPPLAHICRLQVIIRDKMFLLFSTMPQCHSLTMLLLHGEGTIQEDCRHDLYFIVIVLFGRLSKSKRQQNLINRVPN